MGTSAAPGVKVQGGDLQRQGKEELGGRGWSRGGRGAYGTMSFKGIPPLGEKMESRDSEQMGGCWCWFSRPECGGGLSRTASLSTDHRSQHWCARCLEPRETRVGLGLQEAREGWPHDRGRETTKTRRILRNQQTVRIAFQFKSKTILRILKAEATERLFYRG